ncbi:MAG: hypothetical protein HY303_12540 [Candidatus Wallbacteria bacterium]|nr:hypothetical protein [Candidatus Wallbacteria bacterium]
MTEVMRRVLFAGCLFGAIWLALYSRSELAVLRQIDFAGQMERHYRLIGGAPPLEEFIAERTQGNLHKVEGEAWMKFLSEARGALAEDEGKARLREPGKMSARLAGISVARSLYFLVDEQPIGEVVRGLTPDRGLTYIGVQSARGLEYWSLGLVRRASSSHDAPPWLDFPYRKHAGLLLLWGLLAYILVPWQGSGGYTLMYSRWRAALLPDLCGVLLGAGFFALPLLVVTYDSNMSACLEHGYTGVTQVAVCASVFGLAISAVAAWYSHFAVTLEQGSILVRTLRGTRRIATDRIRETGLHEYRLPGWLRAALWLAAIANPRMSGPLVMGTARHSGFRIVPEHGDPVVLWFDGVAGLERLLAFLIRSGVTVSKEVLEHVPDVQALLAAPSDSLLGPREPQATYGKRQAVAVVLVLCGSALALI